MPEAEEAYSHGVTPVTTSTEHKYNKVLDKKTDVINTYLLQHVKYDFYKKNYDLLSVVVYVKEIKKESLQVNFDAKALHLRFQTRSKEFLKLHNQMSEDTFFAWHANLRHKVDSSSCKYLLSATKLTITLKRTCVKDQWNSLEELKIKGNGNKLVMNGGGAYDKSTVSQVAERDFSHLEIKPENGEENFTHCNGNDAKFSSKIQTENIENTKTNSKFELDGDGVPGSISDDEDGNKENISNGTGDDFRTGDILNEKHKNCKFQEETNNSEDVLCSETESIENRVSEKCNCKSTTKKRNVECSRHSLQQHDNDNKYSSHLTSTKENNCQTTDLTCKTNNGKESSSLKVSTTNNVQNSGVSCPKDKVVNENFELSYDTKKHDCRPGSAGLINRLNLCYINSVVQCLSSVRKLRTYLLSKKHCTHINCDSKSGYQGELIITFESIIQELWSGKERYVSASKLKHVLGKKHKQFMHFGQGDAQEFLTFLLDGLHEEMKNNKMKSLSEIKNCDAKDILDGSRKHWEQFINGNHSIISDLFHGQNVFEIHCRECAKPSIGFDHWMQLNLPIPDDPKYLSVYVFFLDPEKKPLKTKLKVCQRTRYADLLIQLSNIVDVPDHCFVLLRSVYSRLSHIFDPIEEVSLSSNNDVLIACEIVAPKQKDPARKAKEECDQSCKSAVVENVDDQANIHVLHVSVIQRLTYRVTGKCRYCGDEICRKSFCSKCCRVEYCNRECQSKDWTRHRQYCKFQPLIIGLPFIISVDSSKATLNELKSKAFHYARYSVAPKNGDLVSNKFHLTLVENLTDIHSKGTTLTDSGGEPVIEGNVCLALDWDAKTPDSKIMSKELDCNIHETVNENRSKEDNSCSLEECLKLYWNPENINKECGWRCDHCKDVRAATRKVMICKHPENLIIVLKRFSYSGNGRKISKHIQFPLRGLDMSTFTHPEITTDGAIYDLRAVCSHYGYMNFGHYIAFCKPYSEEELNTMALTNTDGWLRYDDSKVNSVKESDAEQTQAYILFYHRRKKETIVSGHRSVKSDDAFKIDVCDPDIDEILEATSDVTVEQGTTVKNTNAEITNVIAGDNESTFHRGLESMTLTTQNEVLLEDQLD